MSIVIVVVIVDYFIIKCHHNLLLLYLLLPPLLPLLICLFIYIFVSAASHPAKRFCHTIDRMFLTIPNNGKKSKQTAIKHCSQPDRAIKVCMLSKRVVVASIILWRPGR